MNGRRILSLIGSWRLTVLLLLSLTAAYLAFSFGRNPYPAWEAALFHSPAGIAVCLALMVNLAGISVRIAVSRLAEPEPSPERIAVLDIHIAQDLRGRENEPAFRELVGRLTGNTSWSGPGMRRRTGKWSFLPGTFVRIGVFAVIGSLLVISHARKTHDVVLHAGEERDVLGTLLSLGSLSADLPSDFLQVNDDGPFRLAGVSARVRSGGHEYVITPGFPTRIDGRWYRIRHVGYFQPVTVALRDRRVQVDANLDLLPPGRSSIVSLPSGSAFVTFSLSPDRTITKGLLTGRQYDLARPAYRVTVQEGKAKERPQGTRMRPGEHAVVGPATVALGAQGLFVRLEIVSDPGLPVLYAGMLLLLAGCFSMASRFFWYEREVVVVLRNGVLYAGSRDEFFRTWGIQRFQRWREGLAALNLS